MYQKVKERHDKVIIVASSPEARKFKPIDGYVVIAVNSAIHITKEHTDYWITVDPSESNIQIMEEKPFPAKYFAVVPEWFGTKDAVIPRLRLGNGVPKGVQWLKRIEGDAKDRFIKYGLANDKLCIHTGNSAYGALNLAFHMEPSEIVILGVNGNRTVPKFDNKHCIGNLFHLPKLFESAKAKLDRKRIKVYNANKDTLVKCFAYSNIFD